VHSTCPLTNAISVTLLVCILNVTQQQQQSKEMRYIHTTNYDCITEIPSQQLSQAHLEGYAQGEFRLQIPSHRPAEFVHNPS
jgi:hypothetical protein